MIKPAVKEDLLLELLTVKQAEVYAAYRECETQHDQETRENCLAIL